MGQRDEMTPTDILKINRMYECEAKAGKVKVYYKRNLKMQ